MRNGEYKFIIYSRFGFLDGFDGIEYEWVAERKTAWRFTKEQGQRRIEQLRQKGIDATLHPL